MGGDGMYGVNRKSGSLFEIEKEGGLGCLGLEARGFGLDLAKLLSKTWHDIRFYKDQIDILLYRVIYWIFSDNNWLFKCLKISFQKKTSD